jgi:hypothetical protein
MIIIISLWSGKLSKEENTIHFAVLDKEKEAILGTEPWGVCISG